MIHAVIKNPMDFMTMSKKLKDRVYMSKAEFQRDLDLIYENCIMYNGEVGSSHFVSDPHVHDPKSIHSNFLSTLVLQTRFVR
jgi:hypothetical protein